MTLAIVATLIVSVIPGAIVAPLLGLPLRSLRTWAAIPAFSLALVFVIAEAAFVTGVAFGAPTVAVVVAALAVVAVVWRRRSPARVNQVPAVVGYGGDDGEVDLDTANSDLTNTIAYLLLGLAIVIGLLTWTRGIGGHGLVPPNSDAAYHGFFVARIMHTHSIDVAKVAISDPGGHYSLVSYYPFALHALAAVGAQLTGADIGLLLVAFTVLFSAVVLPLGMFQLARMLAPRSPLIAGFTALVVPSVALFPYAPIQFGDVPIVVGMTLVPVAVVLAIDAITSTGRVREIRPGAMISAALAVVAVVAVHSSQLPLTIALVTLLAVERAVLGRSIRMFGRAIGRGVVLGGIAVVLFAPSLRAFATGVSERSGFDNTPVRALRDVVGPTLGLDPGAFDHPTRQVLLAVVAAIGVAIWLLRRRFAWAAGYILVVAVMLFAAVSDSALSKALSLPWYRGPSRIGWNRAFFVPFFAGVTLAWVVTSIAHAWKNTRRSMVIACVGAVAVTIASIGYLGYETSTDLLRYSFAHNALVTRESESAFAWLAQHSRPDDTIVNDVTPLGLTADDSVWMYPQQGLRPLFGFAQSTASGFKLPTLSAQRDLRDRMFLLTHLTALGRDRRVDALARRYRARWVYLDSRSITNYRHTLDLGALERNPNLRLAFRRGPVYVFKVST